MRAAKQKLTLVKDESSSGTHISFSDEESFDENRIYHVNLSFISPSPFEPQERRRKRFKPEEILELAASIKKQGLLSPVLVRQVRVKDGDSTHYLEGGFEIVFGERRYLACLELGASEIKTFIRNLSDAEVLELQYEENHRRMQNHPLDDAFLFKYLQETSGLTARELADKFATSEKSVTEKLRLNFLVEEARRDLEEERLPLRHAYFLAKFGEDTQKEIYKEGWHYQNWHDWEDGADSYQNFKESVEENIFRKLENAKFDTEDERLLESGLKCSGCEERTGFAPMLFSDLRDGDSCLNKDCFQKKTEAHLFIKRENIASAYLPNDENLPLEKLAKEIPLVTDSYYTSKTFQGEKIKDNQKFLNSDDCGFAVPALVAEGSRYGEAVFICNKKKCEVHNSSEKSEDTQVWEEENKQRQFDQKTRKRTREKVFLQATKNFAESFPFWEHRLLVEKLILDVLPGYDLRKLLFEISSELGFKNIPKDDYNEEELEKFVTSLDPEQTSQILFLLTNIRVGYYSESEKKELTEFARVFAETDYEVLLAETRYEMAESDEQKDKERINLQNLVEKTLQERSR